METPLEERSTWTLQVHGPIVPGEPGLAATATLVVHEKITFQGSEDPYAATFGIHDGHRFVPLYEYGSLGHTYVYAQVIMDLTIERGTHEYKVHWNGHTQPVYPYDGPAEPHDGPLLSPGNYTLTARMHGADKAAQGTITLTPP